MDDSTSEPLDKKSQNEALKRSLNNLKDQLSFAPDYLNYLMTHPLHFNISKYNNNSTLLQKFLRILFKTLNILSFGILFPHKTVIKLFQPGEIIFKKGDTFQYVYIIFLGKAKLLLTRNAKKVDAVNVSAPALFGELSLLENKPRVATAQAETLVGTICIPENDFLKALEQFPSLKSLTVDLKRYYKMPSINTITYQMSKKIEGQQGILTNYKLKSGRAAEGVKVIDQDIFTMTTHDIVPDKKIHYSKGVIRRSLSFYKDILVGIESRGHWDELHNLCVLLLEELNTANSIAKENFVTYGQAFATSADLLYQEKNIVCACMRVSFNAIKNCINAGAKNLDEIGDLTGAGTICGSCKPIINDILGISKWLFAELQLIKEFSKERCLFSIGPIYHHDFPHFQPGQSINVRVLIDNNWIDRTYTLIKSNQDDRYEILVAKRHEGKFSTWLFENDALNSLIKISVPFGDFILDTDPKEDVLCFAEEVGITPFISYLRFLKSKPFRHKITIFYFISDKNNLALPEDILTFIDDNKNIILETFIGYDSTLSLPGITNSIKQHNTNLSYICGNKKFITQISKLLVANNFDRNKIYSKAFFQDDN